MSFAFCDELKLSFGKIVKRVSLKDRPLLVAEIGLNHNKDKNLLKELIEKASESGADAIKLQSYDTDEFIHPHLEAVSELRKIFKQYELDYELHQFVAQYAEECGLLFISTPLSLRWVSLLKLLGVAALKIASGDINNWQLLLEGLKANLPFIISTGASKEEDLEDLIHFFRKQNKQDIILLHCVSLYPTSVEKVNMARLGLIRQKYGVLTGFSDHTLGNEAAFAAVASGGVLIEKHFTLDKNLPGPDHFFSATPEEFKDLRKKMDLAYLIRGEASLDSNPEEFAHDFFGKRSLYETPRGLLALRPRQQHLPKDKDFLAIVENSKI